MKLVKEIDTVKLGEAIIDGIIEKKGKEVTQINLQDTNNSVCDVFIIAHGDSGVQVKAIAKNIEEKIREKFNFKSFHTEGFENAEWILLDYGEILVHIFQKETREYYKLEELWADAKIKLVTEAEEQEF